MFCKHDWTLLSKTYEPGYDPQRVNFKNATEEIIDSYLKYLAKVKEARTGYLFQCTKCKKLRTEILPGKEIEKDTTPVQVDYIQDKTMINISNINFRYLVDYDYDYEYSCDDAGCGNEGICRCATMSNLRAQGHDLSLAIKLAYSHSDSSPERKVLEVMAIKSLTDDDMNDMFTCNVCGGYYGDEIDSIVCSGFDTFIDKINSLSDVDLFRLAVTKEYGFMSECLQNVSKFELKSVKLSDVTVPPSLKAAEKKNEFGTYNKYNLYYNVRSGTKKSGLTCKYLAPLCVAQENTSVHKLVDGCHRYMAAKNAGKKNITILVAS